MPQGFVSIAAFKTLCGDIIPASIAIREKIVDVDRSTGAFWKGIEWGLGDTEVAIGGNLFTNQGRKYLTYAFGGRSPISNYVCSKFGIGTGDRPTTVDDTSLDNPIALSAGVALKDIDGITYPSDYIALVQFTISTTEANGSLIREAGLFSGDGTLLARNVGYNINKTSSFAPVINWRIRF